MTFILIFIFKFQYLNLLPFFLNFLIYFLFFSYSSYSIYLFIFINFKIYKYRGLVGSSDQAPVGNV